MKHILLPILLLWTLLAAAPAFGADITATTNSLANVRTAIANASPGDRVIIPPGTVTWGGGVSISGITLMAATQNGVTINGGSVSMTKHATQLTKLSNLRFRSGSNFFNVGGSQSARALIIDHCDFETNNSTFGYVGVNGGLFHHNTLRDLHDNDSGTADVFQVVTSENWSAAPTFGTADTTGERNIYFEDNTFINIRETMPDADTGSRIVIRYNQYIDSSIVFHSSNPNDSGLNGGVRHFEIYNNNFDRQNLLSNLNKWIWVRGGSGVIANNVMDLVSTPQYGGKVQISLTVGCPGSYPTQYQVGQTSSTPQGPPPQPLAIYGNTGPGATGGSFIGVGGAPFVGCGNPGSFVQQGRDYVFSQTWAYTPYPYPHPLQGSAAPPPPPPPVGTTAPQGLKLTP